MCTLGQTAYRNKDEFVLMKGVEKAIRTDSKYNLVSREYKNDGTVVTAGTISFGGKNMVIIAGQCSVESKGQIEDIAQFLKKSGITFMRGGIYKPRFSSYAFQGLGEEGSVI